jgi:hypothetical protein
MASAGLLEVEVFSGVLAVEFSSAPNAVLDIVSVNERHMVAIELMFVSADLFMLPLLSNQPALPAIIRTIHFIMPF